MSWEGVWEVFGRCLEGVWKVYGRCLEDVWMEFGGSLEGKIVRNFFPDLRFFGHEIIFGPKISLT